MKLYKLYEDIITETSAQMCVKQFGRDLFSDELNNGKERNTSTENNYLDLIKGFTDNEYGESLKPDFIKAVNNLKGCMNTYPEVLIPDKTIIYRGLTIPFSYFINKRQQISLNDWFNYSYKEISTIQSWSTSFDVASGFGNHDILNEEARNLFYKEQNKFNFNTPEGLQELLKYVYQKDIRLAFVLKYQTNKNEFLFKTKYFSKLSAAPAEDEVLRIDNRAINCNVKFNDHEVQFLSSNALKLITLVNRAIQQL